MMTSGLPAPSRVAVRRREEREREQNRRHKPTELSENAEPDSDTPYKITSASVRKFVLSFLVLYAVVAVSLFSVFALQDQTPVFDTAASESEIEPGEEATFAVTVNNPSILGKEIELVLEKDIPPGWIASFCSESQCFYEGCTDRVVPREERTYTVHVITDTVNQEGSVRLLLYCDGKPHNISQFTVKTTIKAQFTAQLLENTPDDEGVSFRIKIANTGNVPDSYQMFVPSGVTAQVSEDNCELGPGEDRDITVYIQGNNSINTSVMITSQSGLSETLYLICEREIHYDFHMYSPKEFYMDQTESEVTFDIVNLGDLGDTYTVHATCLSPEWEVQCFPTTVPVDSKKSERVSVWVKRGEGKNASIIITATSQTGLSKNIKISVYVQKTQGKTVLAEYFTGTWCYVCSYGERALRQLATEVDNLIVLVYHIKDDLEPPTSQKRVSGLYGFADAVSTLVINGNKHVYYTSGGEGTIYFRYKKIIEEMLSAPIKAEINISGHTITNTAYITAEIHSFVTSTVDVWIVLFKNDFEYRGEVKQYIVRDVADPRRITLSDGEVMVSCEFTLSEGESFEGYGVVVIIQNPETLEVIQANSYML